MKKISVLTLCLGLATIGTAPKAQAELSGLSITGIVSAAVAGAYTSVVLSLEAYDHTRNGGSASSGELTDKSANSSEGTPGATSDQASDSSEKSSQASNQTSLGTTGIAAKKQYIDTLRKESMEYLATQGEFLGAVLESVIERSQLILEEQGHNAYDIRERDIVLTLIKDIDKIRF